MRDYVISFLPFLVSFFFSDQLQCEPPLSVWLAHVTPPAPGRGRTEKWS